MKEGKSFRIGVLGASPSALVCCTPLVVTALGLVGFSSWFTWVDSAFHGISAMHRLAIQGELTQEAEAGSLPQAYVCPTDPAEMRSAGSAQVTRCRLLAQWQPKR